MTTIVVPNQGKTTKTTSVDVLYAELSKRRCAMTKPIKVRVTMAHYEFEVVQSDHAEFVTTATSNPPQVAPANHLASMFVNNPRGLETFLVSNFPGFVEFSFEEP